MKKLKKGFTLLELVIVIAVIAILAAILIPTFAGIIKRSKLSNDTMLCKNLNTTAVTLQISTTGTTSTHEVLNAMAENGFTIEKLKTSNHDNILVYDSVSNRFFVYDFVANKISYKDESTTINLTDKEYKVNYWIISETYAQTNTNLQGFSIYLKDGYNGETTLNISTGLDVGANTNIEQINYTNTGNALNVAIRTNGGTLTINAKNDNVAHYGYADSVNVIDVATSSYHEKGEVRFLEVAAGHIVLEAEAEVSAFHFTATNGEFKNAENKTISIDISNLSEEKLPDFSRDAVAIAENGTYVAEVKSDSTEYIWLFGQGIKEQMVVTNTTAPIAENGALKAGIEAGAEDGSVAEQIANRAKRNDAGELLDANDEVITDPQQAVVEEVASKEDIQIGATLFDGGTGTEIDPFIIYTSTNFSNISKITKNEKVWYKLGNNITYDVTGIGNYYYVAEMINGDLDLNGKTLSITTENTNMIIGVGTYAKVHNGTINMNGDVALYDEMNYSLQATLVVDSVDFTGRVTPGGWGPHYGIIDCYAGNTSNNKTIVSTVIINNVNSWVTIKASSTCIGGLLGYCLRANVSITNTNVYSYIETGYGAGGIIMSDTQVCGYEKDPSAIAVGQTWGTVENVKFYGNILVPDGKKAFYFGNTVPAGQDSDYAGSSATLVKGINIDNDILVAENGEFKINANANYTKYVVRYSFSVDFIDDRAGGYPRVIEKEFLNDSNQVISTELYKNKVKEGTFNSNTDTYVTDGSNGIFTRAGASNTYFYDGIGTYKLSKYGVTVTVYAYNGESLKAVGSYSYPKD